jgi:hypothetical protein
VTTRTAKLSPLTAVVIIDSAQRNACAIRASEGLGGLLDPLRESAIGPTSVRSQTTEQPIVVQDIWRGRDLDRRLGGRRQTKRELFRRSNKKVDTAPSWG